MVAVMIAVMVVMMVVMVLRPMVLRGRRIVPRNLVLVGGLSRLNVPMFAGRCLRDVFGRCGCLGSHSGRSLAFCWCAALWCSSGSSAESAAKCNGHHQFL